jgi:hypothetical protein
MLPDKAYRGILKLPLAFSGTGILGVTGAAADPHTVQALVIPRDWKHRMQLTHDKHQYLLYSVHSNAISINNLLKA